MRQPLVGLTFVVVAILVSGVKWRFNLPYYILLGGTDANPDQPFRSWVEKEGYPVEVHKDILTPDGYLLTLFRIPHGLNDGKCEEKEVAFLMHGLLGAAEDWVVLGPTRALAYRLADGCYDVWLGNARGNIHSRKHVRLNPTLNGEFWDFSFHEIAVFDLPTMFDYVISVTGKKQMYYVGHSQGGTTFFICMAMRPEYNDAFKLMVALAPGVLMSHTQSLLLRILSVSDSFNLFGGTVAVDAIGEGTSPLANSHYIPGGNELWAIQPATQNLLLGLGLNDFPHTRLSSLLGDTICSVKGIPQLLCANIQLYVYGGYSSQLNLSLVPKLLHYQFAGAALKQGIHYAQEVRSGRFCQYDHGKAVNIKVYGSEDPPSYNISEISTKIVYMYGNHDKLAAREDQKNSIRLFANIVEQYEIPFDGFTHLDMFLASDIGNLAYNLIIKLMGQYK